MSDAMRERAIALEDECYELRIQNSQLRRLVETMLDNDPSEPIADNGMTVLDGWREDARRVLKR